MPVSDDTPTQRFDAAGDGLGRPGAAGDGLGQPGAAGDAPTERIAVGDPLMDGTPEVASEEVVEERKSRRLMLILGIVGGVLLLGVIILLVLLLTRGSGTPSTLPTGSPTPSTTPTSSATPTATATPTPTPTPTPTQTQPAPPPPPPPPPAPPAIESFTVSDDQVDCSSGDPVPLSFDWNTNGTSVTFAVGVANAENGPYETGLAPVGGIDIDYQCGQGSQVYSIAVYDGGSIIGREAIEVSEN
jgi:hypothetical protein